MRRIRLARLLMKAMAPIPRRFPIHSHEEMIQPVFVLGSGRNGSTLLNRILNQHPTLFAPSEQYFLGQSIIKFHLYNHLITWRDMVKVITGELGSTTGSHTWEVDTSGLMPRLFSSEDKSLQYLLDQVYRNYTTESKSEGMRWVDTSPPNTQYIREIYRTFPKASYVFLLRDGRDVISSYVKGGEEHFGPLSVPVAAARCWNQSIKAYDWLQKRTKVSFLQYESLVTKPEGTLTRLCQELGISYHQDMLDFHQAPRLKGHQEAYYQNIEQPIFADAVGKWKSEMDQAVLSDILPLIEDHLRKFNYL